MDEHREKRKEEKREIYYHMGVTYHVYAGKLASIHYPLQGTSPTVMHHI